MSLDPTHATTPDRTPVLVGLSQILQRADPGEARSPLQLMIDAVRSAANDTQAPKILERASAIRVVKGIWGYKNPVLDIAQALELGSLPETGVSVLGGNHVQMLVNESCLDIQQGRHDVVILTGAECGRTMGKAPKQGIELDWLEEVENDPRPLPDVTYGDARWTRHEAEMAKGLERPAQYYSLFEVALRHQAGLSVEEHDRRVAELWARFSQVATDNPNAWIRREVTADEIRTRSESNRPITQVYPKLMNANMRVDMGAALILCSLATARSLMIPEDAYVFPVSGTDAYDHYYVSERSDLHSSPAIRIAGGRALELADLDASQLDHVDLYSCFPSAVKVAANELGLETSRPLTVTGGLTFGGGPLNNYVMHSIARTAELLRGHPEQRALVTANGGMLTKHSFGVYSGSRPEHAFRHQNVQDEIDATPRCEVVTDVTSNATIESYVVVYGGTGARPSRSYTSIYGKAQEISDVPSLAHLACRLDDGRRTWANLEDQDVLEAMCVEEFCGAKVRLSGGNAKVV